VGSAFAYQMGGMCSCRGSSVVEPALPARARVIFRVGGNVTVASSSGGIRLLRGTWNIRALPAASRAIVAAVTCGIARN